MASLAKIKYCAIQTDGGARVSPRARLPPRRASPSGARVHRNRPETQDVLPGHRQRVRRRFRGCVIATSATRALPARATIVPDIHPFVAVTPSVMAHPPARLARVSSRRPAEILTTTPLTVRPVAPAAKAGKKVTARSAAKCVSPPLPRADLRKTVGTSGEASRRPILFFSPSTRRSREEGAPGSQRIRFASATSRLEDAADDVSCSRPFPESQAPSPRRDARRGGARG